MHAIGDLLPRESSIHARCQQRIVLRMFMTDGGRYSSGESMLFKLPARGGSANPATAPRGRVRGDGRNLWRWTTRKHTSDPHGHLGDQGAVLLLAPRGP